jgi:hypothetical protein
MGEDTGGGSLSLTWERAARATRVPGEGAPLLFDLSFSACLAENPGWLTTGVILGAKALSSKGVTIG